MWGMWCAQNCVGCSECHGKDTPMIHHWWCMECIHIAPAKCKECFFVVTQYRLRVPYGSSSKNINCSSLLWSKTAANALMVITLDVGSANETRWGLKHCSSIWLKGWTTSSAIEEWMTYVHVIRASSDVRWLWTTLVSLAIAHGNREKRSWRWTPQSCSGGKSYSARKIRQPNEVAIKPLSSGWLCHEGE